MANDVWIDLVKGPLAFGHSRAAGLVDEAFKGTGSFLAALAEDPMAETPLTNNRFDAEARYPGRESERPAGRRGDRKTNQSYEGRDRQNDRVVRTTEVWLWESCFFVGGRFNVASSAPCREVSPKRLKREHDKNKDMTSFACHRRIG